MKGHQSEDLKIVDGPFRPFLPFHDEKTLFRAARCEYGKGGNPVTVYHYFLRTGEKLPKDPKNGG